MLIKNSLLCNREKEAKLNNILARKRDNFFVKSDILKQEHFSEFFVSKAKSLQLKLEGMEKKFPVGKDNEAQGVFEKVGRGLVG